MCSINSVINVSTVKIPTRIRVLNVHIFNWKKNVKWNVGYFIQSHSFAYIEEEGANWEGELPLEERRGYQVPMLAEKK